MYLKKNRYTLMNKIEKEKKVENLNDTQDAGFLKLKTFKKKK